LFFSEVTKIIGCNKDIKLNFNSYISTLGIE